MSVCAFNSLPNAEYSNLLIVVAFSHNTFSGIISSSIFLDDKAEILTVFLSKFY